MKRIYKRLLCVIAAIVMTALCACGGDDGPDDPNVGIYKATKAEMSGFEIGVADMFSEGFTIELKNKGKGRVEMDGDGGNIKWMLDGDTFHAEGGGAEFDGTLHDGVMVLEDLQGAGVTLTLVCDEIASAAKTGAGDNAVEGETEGETGKESLVSSKLGDAIGAGKSTGKWKLFNFNQNGVIYMEDELADKGIEATIEMNPDGSGRINLVGTLMDMTWDNGTIKVPDNGEGESEEYRYSISNEYLVLIDGDSVLTFIGDDSGDDSGADSKASALANAKKKDDSDLYNAGAEISEDLMKRFEGDWHGLMLYTNAQGDTFADRDGKKNDVIARICLDESGKVIDPFFAAAMKDDPNTHNFRNVTAELDPEFDGMYISGEYLAGGSFDTEFVDVTDGFMYTALKVTAENGDSIDVTIGMKRPDEKWTDEDYPRYPDEGVEYYKGKSLEYVMSTFGNPPKGMPEQTHVTDWDE